MKEMPSTDSVWSQLNSDLRRFIRHRVSDEHVAEDLLQEVFVRIHQHVNSLADADRLMAWVYQIARNVIHDHYRRPASSIGSLSNADLAEERDDQSAQSHCPPAAWMDELITQLPDRYREAVSLSEIQGLKQQEIADRLSLSLSGAKSRIQRGRAMLKALLDQCCKFEFDRRGNLIDIEPKPGRAVCLNCDQTNA